MKFQIPILFLFIIFLGGCKPSQVFVARSEEIPFFPNWCVEDTQFVLNSVKMRLGIRRKTQVGTYSEQWWRFPDDVYCTWAKGFVFDVQAGTITNYFINDKRPDKDLGEYLACGDVSLFTWGKSNQVERILRDTLDMEVCGTLGLLPLYQGKYLIFFPKYAGIMKYVMQYHKDKIPILIVKIEGKNLLVVDSVLVPLPVASLRKTMDFVNVESGFNANTLVLGFGGLDTMVIVQNFRIEKDKAKYSRIIFVQCTPKYATQNIELWKTPAELKEEANPELAMIYEGLKRTYFKNIYYEPKKKRWYRVVQVPFNKGKLPEDIKEAGLSYKDIEILIWNKHFHFIGSVLLKNEGKFYARILGSSQGQLILGSAPHQARKLYYLDFK